MKRAFDEYGLFVGIGFGLLIWGIYGGAMTPSPSSYAKRGIASLFLYPWVRIIAGIGILGLVFYWVSEDKELETKASTVREPEAKRGGNLLSVQEHTDMEADRRLAVQYLRSNAPVGFNFEELVVKPYVELGLLMCLVDGQFDEMEGVVLYQMMSNNLGVEINLEEMAPPSRIEELLRLEDPFAPAKKLKKRLGVLVAEPSDRDTADIRHRIFVNGLISSLATIVTADGKIEDIELNYLLGIMDVFEFEDEFKAILLRSLVPTAETYLG